MSDPTRPAAGVVTVTQSDTADIDKSKLTNDYPRSLHIGGAGNVKVTAADGTVATFEGVTANTILPVQTRRVWDTGTTVTAAIVGLY